MGRKKPRIAPMRRGLTALQRWAIDKAGRLKKEPCETCGAAKAQAHHDDYLRPLDVRWLCRACHAAWHRVNVPLNWDAPIPEPVDERAARIRESIRRSYAASQRREFQAALAALPSRKRRVLGVSRKIGGGGGNSDNSS